MEMEKKVGDWDFPSLAKYFEALIEAQRQIREQCSEIVQKRQAWTYGLGFCITHWRQLTNTKPSDLARMLKVDSTLVIEAEKGRSSAILTVLKLMVEKRLVAGSANNMVIPPECYGRPDIDDAAK